MNILNSVFDLNWTPRTVIEASAGTGKTYTIVGLYVRLLIEKQLNPDQILVMTFTNKATAELRGRILMRLRECASYLEGDVVPESDDFLTEFNTLADNNGRDKVLVHLRNAIRNFDDSRVFTIHGFCQRVLTEEPLLMGAPMEVDIIQTDDLLLEAAEDYWRNIMYEYSSSEPGKYYIQKLLSIASNPEELIGRKGLGNLFRELSATVEGHTITEPIAYLESLISLRTRLAKEWNENREDILGILRSCDVSRYKGYLSSRVKKLEEFVSDNTYSKDTAESLKYFTSDYLYDENNLNKDGLPTTEHHFFEICSQYHNLVSDIDHLVTTIKKSVYETIAESREKRSKNSDSLTFDDLIKTLNSALKGDRGLELANKLRKAYPYALVDEFQDTDSLQYSILNNMYPTTDTNSSLLMIGDPKQAIYGFRGADVYTYFRAKEDGNPEQFSLNKNYRSSKNLIEAVNVLFGPGEREAFIEGDIPFFDSQAGNNSIADDYVSDSDTPLGITAHPDLFTNKSLAKEFVFNQTVRQVAELLESGNTKIKDAETNEFRKAKAGDIAILVNTNNEAFKLKQKLKTAGIGSVTYSNKKVFETLEAQRLELLMDAVLNPQKNSSVNSALISGLYGIDISEIYKTINEDEKRQSIVDELIEAFEIWSYSGFQAMVREIFNKPGRIDQLVELQNSERILTNLYQLTEICSEYEKDEKLDPFALHTWFKKEMSNPNKSDEQTLLLESDRNLVKISTIHGCKGLEFPIVFCPVLWESKKPNHRTKEYPYHKENGSHIINIDEGDTEEKKIAKERHTIESIAEDVRKAYVALTRAKYECKIIWATHDECHTSGFGAALLGKSQFLEHFESKMKDGSEFDQQSILQLFKKLSSDHPEYIHFLESTNGEPVLKKIYLGDDDSSKVNLKRYSGRKELFVKKRVESFSSLSGHKSEAGAPDYDQITEWYVGAREKSDQADESRTIFTFPKGALPGTVIHKLFEHPDFSFEGFSKPKSESYIRDVLSDYGISEEWSGVLSMMMDDVINADYNELTLSNVKNEDQIREMEFHFPVKGLNTDGLLEMTRGNKTVSSFTDSEQFLNGFIDLIVRQNGKYYIIDYKSNHLGDSVDDYSQENMKNEIESASYDLQYHIYTLALNKFLKQKIKNFNYEKDFGGVMYLFVRGMKKGSDNGIWFDKPDASVIHNLENALKR